MKPRSVTSLLMASTLLSLLMIVPGCSKDSSAPTGPVAEPFDSGDMENLQSFQRTFANAGSFSYRCRRHQNMTGTVTVATGGADSAHIHISGNQFHPPIAGGLPIRPGGYVRWVNGDGVLHTVTRP